MNRGVGFAGDLAWAMGWPHRADRATLEAFQLRRLRALVRHAWDHVPFYRRWFERAGVAPDQIRTLADLERVPIVDKEDFRQAGADAVADDVDRSTLIPRLTSGTSGVPFEVLRTRDEVKLLTGIALFVLRLRFPLVARPFKVPMYPIVPVVFVGTCTFLLYRSLLFTLENKAIQIALYVMAAGVVAWVAMQFRRSR